MMSESAYKPASYAQRIAAAAKDGRILSGLARRLGCEFHLEALYRLLLRQRLQPRSSGQPLPAIQKSGNFTSTSLGVALEQAFEKALAGIGGPAAHVRAMEGMSGQKYRTFINSLIGALPDARYLEVGSYAGSTAASALFGNKVRALCIDNWSQFDGPKEQFLANLKSVQSPDVDFSYIENDFRRVDYSTIGRFNVYLFDGPHTEQDQYDGVRLAMPALEKCFVLIIDDWNWVGPRLGTYRAIRDAGCSIVCSIEVRTTTDNSHPIKAHGNSDWHNGYFFGVLAAPA
ncbi:MAG: class I SAM-dependent methyltransferase [Reyranella sp.]|nr:class I SAM-dependent methyltransferase [Reyranella sp.]